MSGTPSHLIAPSAERIDRPRDLVLEVRRWHLAATSVAQQRGEQLCSVAELAGEIVQAFESIAIHDPHDRAQPGGLQVRCVPPALLGAPWCTA